MSISFQQMPESSVVVDRLHKSFGSLDTEDKDLDIVKAYNMGLGLIVESIKTPSSLVTAVAEYNKIHKKCTQLSINIRGKELDLGKAELAKAMVARRITCLDVYLKLKKRNQAVITVGSVEASLEDTQAQEWQALFEYAQTLDDSSAGVNSYQEKLSSIHASWMRQNNVAHLSASDLHEQFIHLDSFMVYTNSLLQSLENDSSSDDIIKELQSILKYNLELSQELKQQMLASISMRLRACSTMGSINFDDLFAYRNFCIARVLGGETSGISENFKYSPDDVLEGELDDSIFDGLCKIVKEHGDKEQKKELKRLSWNRNDESPKLSLTVTDDYSLVPTTLFERGFIPQSPPTNFVLGLFGLGEQNYSFFRNNEIVSKINSAAANMRRVSDRIKSADFPTALDQLASDQVFRSSLTLNRRINDELKRIDAALKNNYFSWFFYFVPFLRRFDSRGMLMRWREELLSLQDEYKADMQVLSRHIATNLSANLFKDIAKYTFLFSKDTLKNMQQFVQSIGMPEDIQTFDKAIDPLSLFRSFDFYTSNSSSIAELNINAVNALRTFAQMYLRERAEAVEIIMDIVEGKKYPTTKEEVEQTIKTITSLFKNSETPLEDANKFLVNEVVNAYVVRKRIDDEGASRLIALVSPEAQRHRESMLASEAIRCFTVVNVALQTPLGSEVNLKSGAVLRSAYKRFRDYAKHLDTIDTVDSGFIKTLIRNAATYIDAYDGSNSVYAQLITNLCVRDELGRQPLNEYMTKRLRFLIRNPSEINEEDRILVKDLSSREPFANSIYRIIYEDFNGENLNLFSLVKNSSDLVLNVFYRKRVDFIIRNNLELAGFDVDNIDNFLKSKEQVLAAFEENFTGAQYYCLDLLGRCLGGEHDRQIIEIYRRRLMSVLSSDISLRQQDINFISLLKGNDVFSEMVSSLLQELYNGTINADVQELVFNLENPQIDSSFVVAKLRRMTEVDSYILEQREVEIFTRACKQEEVVAQLSDIVSARLAFLIESGSEEVYCSSSFMTLVERHCNAQVKEMYRLKRIELLLSAGDHSLTTEYFSQLGAIGVDTVNMFQTVDGLNGINTLLENTISSSERFRGNTQEIITLLDSCISSELLGKYRLRWFIDFCSKPDDFLHMDFEDIDRVKHEENYAMIYSPEQFKAVKEPRVFFGDSNLDVLAKFIENYFKEHTLNTTSYAIRLMNMIMLSNSMQVMPNKDLVVALKSTISLGQKAKGQLHANLYELEGIYDIAVVLSELLALSNVEAQGLVGPSGELIEVRTKKAGEIIAEIESMVFKFYVDSVFEGEPGPSGIAPNKAYREEVVGQLLDLLPMTRGKEDKYKELLLLDNELFTSYNTILKQLREGNWVELNLNKETAILFGKFLDKDRKEALLNEFSKVVDLEPDMAEPLEEFYRLIESSQASGTTAHAGAGAGSMDDDLPTAIDEFARNAAILQDDIDAIGVRLTVKIREKQPISDERLFVGSTRTQFRRKFLEKMTDTQVDELAMALNQYLIDSDDMVCEDIPEDMQEMLARGKILELLASSRKISEDSQLKKTLNAKLDRSFAILNSVSELEQEYLYRNLDSVINSCMFIRCFGSRADKEALSILQDRLLSLFRISLISLPKVIDKDLFSLPNYRLTEKLGLALSATGSQAQQAKLRELNYACTGKYVSRSDGGEDSMSHIQIVSSRRKKRSSIFSNARHVDLSLHQREAVAASLQEYTSNIRRLILDYYKKKFGISGEYELTSLFDTVVTNYSDNEGILTEAITKRNVSDIKKALKAISSRGLISTSRVKDSSAIKFAVAALIYSQILRQASVWQRDMKDYSYSDEVLDSFHRNRFYLSWIASLSAIEENLKLKSEGFMVLLKNEINKADAYFFTGRDGVVPDPEAELATVITRLADDHSRDRDSADKGGRETKKPSR